MSKINSFKFYPDAYIGGTMGFSLEQHGAYLLLLIYQFNNGPFTEEKAISIVGDVIFKSIKNKFDEEDCLIFNSRLMKEMNKKILYSSSRRENSLKRWEEDAVSNEINSTYRVCSELLKNRIQEKRKAVIDEEKLIKWDDVVRLMVEKDGYSVDDIISTINACHDMPQNHSGFSWADNILSMETLRLRMKEGKVYPGMSIMVNNIRKFGRQNISMVDLKGQYERLKDK